MSANPKVKRVISLADSAVASNAALNKQVDDAFDEGLGAYQTSQENTLAQIDGLYERISARVKAETEKHLGQADEKAYKAIMDAYAKDGLKGEQDAK